MQKQTIFLVIFAVILAAIAYLWYSRALTRPTIPDTSTIAVDFEKSVSNLRRLKNVRLDTAVLQEPLFKSLRVFRPAEPVPPPPGRNNPFVPPSEEPSSPQPPSPPEASPKSSPVPTP